ncbi:hypothetical protein BDW22DRAFT_404093 [Trametopsis cervina]|nr:hypothetical protein BDW22DRAFT_404093 [Trametopsis cervina]
MFCDWRNGVHYIARRALYIEVINSGSLPISVTTESTQQDTEHVKFARKRELSSIDDQLLSCRASHTIHDDDEAATILDYTICGGRELNVAGTVCWSAGATCRGRGAAGGTTADTKARPDLLLRPSQAERGFQGRILKLFERCISDCTYSMRGDLPRNTWPACRQQEPNRDRFTFSHPTACTRDTAGRRHDWSQCLGGYSAGSLSAREGR